MYMPPNLIDCNIISASRAMLFFLVFNDVFEILGSYNVYNLANDISGTSPIRHDLVVRQSENQ